MGLAVNLIANISSFKMLNGLLNFEYYTAKIERDQIGQFVSHPDLWFMEPQELKQWQYKAIKKSFGYHFNKCEFYRRYCEKEGNSITPESIKNSMDILKIPQLPAEAFKKTRISSIPKKKIKKVVTTSGTSGNPSYLVRDNKSLMYTGIQLFRWVTNHWIVTLANDNVERYAKKPEKYGKCIGCYKTFKEAIKKGFKNGLKNLYVGVFTPEINETSTWVVNAFSTIIPFLKLLHLPIDFYLKGFEFDPERILNIIKERNKKNKMMIFLGFHYVFNELMEYMNETGEKLNLDHDGSNMCFILMAGGWKKLSGEEIDKAQFKKKLSKYFGIWEPYILDMYGFGESSLLTFDFCPKGSMHIPPTALCRTRDPKTLEIQDFGEEGLLSAWDPTMHSFPSFVITDDIVKLTKPFKCECGLITQTMEHKGRATGAELRSCGLKLGKIISEKDKKELEELKEKQKLRTGVGI
jgi:long-chain-fatty-acid---luciferin-component ligase